MQRDARNLYVCAGCGTTANADTGPMPDIVLAPVVDSIDTIPESHREYYEARDGKHFLAKPIKIEDTGGLKSARDKTRQELDELRKAASKQKEPSPEIQELKQL